MSVPTWIQLVSEATDTSSVQMLEHCRHADLSSQPVSWVTMLVLVCGCPVCQVLSVWHNSGMKFLPKIWKQTQLLGFSNILYFDGFLPRALKIFLYLEYTWCYINWFLYRNGLKMHLYQFSLMCFRLHRQILKCQETYHVVCPSQLQRDLEHARRLCRGKVTMVTSWWANVVSKHL